MASELHTSGWILIAWIVGGLITLLGALSNAEVAGLLADTGGDYAYYKTIYNRFFAFLYGWSLFAVIQTAAISSLAYVFAQSLASIVQLPAFLSGWADFNLFGIFFPFADFSVKLTAILLILILTLINMLGIKSGAGVSKLVLYLVFGGILIISFFGLTSAKANLSQPFDFAISPDHSFGISAFFTAMLSAFWGYQGWATVGFIGGEVKDPNRSIPKGILVGVFTVIAIYLLLNFTYLTLLSASDYAAIYQSGKGIAAVEAVRSFWGENGVLLISLIILISTLGCTNATILGSSRPYYAMAREGYFLQSAGHLNRKHVPSNSLLIQGVWASLLVLSGTFDQLTDMVIFAVFFFYAATSLGVFVLRHKMPEAHRPYRVWGYPVVPVVFIIFCVGLIINTFVSRPREAMLGLVLILSGVPYYFWRRRKRDQTEPS